MAPEFGEFLPAAEWDEMKIAVGSKDADRRLPMHAGIPEQGVPECLHGDDEAGLAFGLPGAQAEPGGDGEW